MMQGGAYEGGAPGASAPAAYESLLNTVESLQADLQQTITTCHGLREANGQLQKNYEACKAELLRQKEKFTVTREELIEASRSKIESDRHTELLVRKWKVQLDERTRELEELQAKLVPQDLDMLRIQVQEELEVPHQQKVAELEGQAAAFQQMFFNVRRELERSKTEFEQYAAYHGGALGAEQERHAAEVREARKRVSELEAAVVAAEEGGGDAHGEADSKLVEANVVTRALKAENEALRAELARRTGEAEEALAAKGTAVIKAEAARASVAADKAGIERRLTELVARQSEVEHKAAEQRRDAEGRAARAEHAAKVALEDQRLTKKDLNALQQVLETLRRDKDAEVADAVRAADTADRRASAGDIALAAAKRAAAEAKQAADGAVAQARAEARDLVSKLEDRVLHLDLDRSDADRKHRVALAAATDAHRKLEAELKIKDTHVARLNVEKAQAVAATDRARAELRDATQRFEEASRHVADLEDTVASMRRDAVVTATDLSQRTAEALTAHQLQRDLDRVLDASETQRKQHLKALADLKRAVKADRAQVADQIRHETDHLRKKAQDDLKKERKRAEAYKAKALAAHDRSTRAAGMLRTLTNADRDRLVETQQLTYIAPAAAASS